MAVENSVAIAGSLRLRCDAWHLGLHTDLLVRGCWSALWRESSIREAPVSEVCTQEVSHWGARTRSDTGSRSDPRVVSRRQSKAASSREALEIRRWPIQAASSREALEIRQIRRWEENHMETGREGKGQADGADEMVKITEGCA